MDLYDHIQEIKKHLSKISIYEENAFVITVWLLILAVQFIKEAPNENIPDLSAVNSQLASVVSAFSLLRFIPLILIIVVASFGWTTFLLLKYKKPKEAPKKKKHFKIPRIDISRVRDKSIRKNVVSLRENLGRLYDTISEKLW